MNPDSLSSEIDHKRQKLRFRAWHRGTREMDLILGSFADTYISDFSEEELDAFQELLTCSDPDLYNWYSKKEDLPEDYRNDVFTRFLDHRIQS